jgi:hypothetical protein
MKKKRKRGKKKNKKSCLKGEGKQTFNSSAPESTFVGKLLQYPLRNTKEPFVIRTLIPCTLVTWFSVP